MTDTPTVEANTMSRSSPATRRSTMFVKYVSGFGVGVALGLSVWLGKIRVPGFAPLLDLIPVTLQGTLIPLSSIQMGVVAILIEWYGAERLGTAWLQRQFRVALLILSVGFVAFMTAHTFTVVSVAIDGGNRTVSFQVGFTRPTVAPCSSMVSDAECIKRLSFDPARIASFWGDRQVQLATLFTCSSYLIVTGSFGFLVGLLMLKSG